MPVTSATLPQERQFLLMLKILLERAYQDGIDQFYDWSVQNDTVKGRFRDGKKVFQFAIGERGVEYGLVEASRKDAELEPAGYVRSVGVASLTENRALSLDTPVLRIDQAEYTALQALHPQAFEFAVERQDRKTKNCSGPTSFACGGACINNQKICRLQSRSIASRKELDALLKLGRQVKVSSSTGTPMGASPVPLKPDGTPKGLHEMTIRELRQEARNRGMPGYSHINKKEALEGAIKTWDATPEDQKRISRTIKRREQQVQGEPLKEWMKLLKIAGRWESAPLLAGAAMLALTKDVYNKVRDNYRGNFGESANIAQNRAQGIELDAIGRKQAITFTVDGFTHDDQAGTKGERLKTALQKADPEFFGKHHIIAIKGEEFNLHDDLPTTIPVPVRDAVKQFKNTHRMLTTTLINGRNPQSVELASHILAYHKKYPNMPINLVGHSAGGMVINEAVEIIAKAGPQGPTLAANLRVVNLGTPHFGMTDAVANPKGTNRGATLTISSSHDPTNVFPKLNGVQVNTVKGHSIQEYLGDEHALKLVKDTLGANEAKNAEIGRLRPSTLPKVDPSDPSDPRNSSEFGVDEATSMNDLKKYVDRKRKEEKEAKSNPGQAELRRSVQYYARLRKQEAAAKAAENAEEAKTATTSDPTTSEQPLEQAPTDPVQAPAKPTAKSTVKSTTRTTEATSPSTKTGKAKSKTSAKSQSAASQTPEPKSELEANPKTDPGLEQAPITTPPRTAKSKTVAPKESEKKEPEKKGSEKKTEQPARSQTPATAASTAAPKQEKTAQTSTQVLPEETASGSHKTGTFLAKPTGAIPAAPIQSSSKEWKELADRANKEPADKNGYSQTQKAYVAARLLAEIKKGDILAVPVLPKEAKNAVFSMASERASLKTTAGKDPSLLQLGTGKDKEQAAQQFADAGLGSISKPGVIQLNAAGAKLLDGIHASRNSEKLTVDIPGRGGNRLSINRTSLAIDGLLLGLGLKYNQLGEVAQLLHPRQDALAWPLQAGTGLVSHVDTYRVFERRSDRREGQASGSRR